MSLPADKLAESLDALKSLQDKGLIAIRAAQLSRTHRQRLLAAGFLREVMKGWYISARPANSPRIRSICGLLSRCFQMRPTS
jgi:hypothetical protein